LKRKIEHEGYQTKIWTQPERKEQPRDLNKKRGTELKGNDTKKEWITDAAYLGRKKAEGI